MRDFTFDEMATNYADAVRIANGLFLARTTSSRSAKTAQLLVIISDGQGVYSDGKKPVIDEIRAARQAGVFIVFIIVENPNSTVCKIGFTGGGAVFVKLVAKYSLKKGTFWHGLPSPAIQENGRKIAVKPCLK